MAKLSPEALEKIAAALPDTYEDNPDQFLTDYQALQDARAEADKLRQVGTWYEESYKPWFNTYGQDFTEFQKWKQQGQQTPDPEPTRTEPAARSTDTFSIDYDSPDALKDAVTYLSQQLDTTRREFDNRFGLVDSTIQQRSEELQRLLALQEQAYGLLNEATWDRIEPGWRPPVDIPKLVNYAQQENIPDLRRAWQSYSQTDREKELERRAYERGREEAAREAASRTVTTEMTGGAPFRHALPRYRKPGNAGAEEIINRAHQRWAQRRAS